VTPPRRVSAHALTHGCLFKVFVVLWYSSFSTLRVLTFARLPNKIRPFPGAGGLYGNGAGGAGSLTGASLGGVGGMGGGAGGALFRGAGMGTGNGGMPGPLIPAPHEVREGEREGGRGGRGGGREKGCEGFQKSRKYWIYFRPLPPSLPPSLPPQIRFVDLGIPWPEQARVRFFVIKSLNYKNLAQSVRRGVWRTHRNNERTLNEVGAPQHPLSLPPPLPPFLAPTGTFYLFLLRSFPHQGCPRT